MTLSILLRTAGIVALGAILASCSGNSGSSGGGGGLVITAVSPSSQMISSAVGTGTFIFEIYGHDFTSQMQVMIDGQPTATTTFGDSHTLFAQVNVNYSSFLGTHQFTVTDGTTTSNPVPFTLYLPKLGPSVMQAIPSYLVGNESDPTFVAVGDLNGDGYADVVMQAPQYQIGLTILYGQSDGSLALPQYLATSSPYACVISDVDGNGTADIVMVSTDNSSISTLTTLLNDGQGNFQPATGTTTFSDLYPSSLQFADIDGDGKPDAVLVAIDENVGVQLLWFKNLGGGNFGEPAVITSSVAPDNSVYAIADVNGDGRPDILYSVYNASGPEPIHTLINQGNGQFSDTPTAGLNGVTGPFFVFDFNLDGKPDLVVQVPTSEGITFEAFAGDGDGTFSLAASTNIGAPFAGFAFQLAAGDFDHDGFPDMVGTDGTTTPSHIVYFFGDGKGNFTPLNVVGPQGSLLAVADVNGDGIPDVIVPDRFNFVSVSLGRKDRGFPSLLALTPATSNSPSAGDINGDGRPEIFVGGDSFGGVQGTVFQNLGNGAFQVGAYTNQDSNALADLTGRGVMDLIGGSSDVNLQIWPNNGTFGFSSSSISIPPPVTGPFTVADMDKDGHPDIVQIGGILYGNSNYQFTPVALPDTFETYAIGDFNGDGLPDIASDTFVFLNTGDRTFKAVNAGVGAPNLSQGSMAVVADFNGDGFDDIAIAWPQNSGVFIYYSRGDGTFYLGAVLDTGQLVGGNPGALCLAVGDFDGDGHPDIAAGLWDSQQLVIFFNNGAGEYARSFLGAGAMSIGLTSSTLVHAGKPDLVIANFNVDFAAANVNVMFHQ
ncbi:MAG: FG-GAP repeat domain-containing protein [Candidatus Sulfotelmatobacter sp.]